MTASSRPGVTRLTKNLEEGDVRSSSVYARRMITALVLIHGLILLYFLPPPMYRDIKYANSIFGVSYLYSGEYVILPQALGYPQGTLAAPLQSQVYNIEVWVSTKSRDKLPRILSYRPYLRLIPFFPDTLSGSECGKNVT